MHDDDTHKWAIFHDHLTTNAPKTYPDHGSNPLVALFVTLPFYLFTPFRLFEISVKYYPDPRLFACLSARWRLHPPFVDSFSP
ncbi:hypothetical protein BC937DRAFT_95253 [Endogone sp. FLAS-F59071]|nr:hypothetical protein BC937DRAFT_95253 [Endogone sp. FLAS-F59071]|eukprot:RUS13477.1 hypothetical protein BC937DRAFT_95253 [Endogone sp. FLAS-F59071]